MTSLGSVDEPLNLTGERLTLTPRTDDPADIKEGQAWIRKDKSADSYIAVLRYYDGNSTQDIPIRDVNKGDETKALRALKIDGEDGYIPTESRQNADHPKFSVQTDSGWLGFTGTTIPDTVVSRTEDNREFSDEDREAGLICDAKTPWPSIGARISNLTSDADTAILYLLDDSDNITETLDTLDISTLTSGDAFGFDDVNIESGDRIAIVVDGSNYTFGDRDGDWTPPIESDDLDIIGSWLGGSRADLRLRGVNDIGNPDGILD